MKAVSAAKVHRVAITLGDPNGIGPELLVEVLQDAALRQQVAPILYGPLRAWKHVLSLSQEEIPNYQVIQEEKEARGSGIYIINVEAPGFRPSPGQPSPTGTKSAYLALERACVSIKAGATEALITCPLAKESFSEAGFAGHTEYLQARFGAPESLMLLCGPHMRLALLSGHVPLAQVPALLSPNLLQRKYELLYKALKEDFGIAAPRVALLALNPHAGEKGRLGDEETTLLRPFVQAQRAAGHLLKGPYAADGFFASHSYQHFDAVLALYHDQGLIPFKTICFEQGVNYTAGLPIIRTSPAHGTAYALVGQQKASSEPLRASISMALHLLSLRKNKVHPKS